MRWLDALGVALVLGAGGAFLLGQSALARTDDLVALYWLAVGAASLRAAVQMSRGGART